SSDNIPGVRGVGPKGAQKLLTDYESLEDIYKNLDKITPEGVRNKLKESKKEAFLAKNLVTIRTDIDLGLKLDDMKLKAIDRADLKTFLDELEFSAFLRKLFPDEAGPDEKAPNPFAKKGKKAEGPGSESAAKEKTAKKSTGKKSATTVKV